MIRIEVVYGTAERQVLLPLEVGLGTTALEAAQQSRIADYFPGLDVAEAPLGVFSRRVKPQHVLEDGDRVEIYRPLVADPREVRRKLAAEGKTMGRRHSASGD